MTPLRFSLRLRIAVAIALVSAALVALVGMSVDRSTTLEGRERSRDQAVTQLSTAVDIYDQFGTLRLDASVDPDRPPKSLRSLPVGGTATLYAGATMWAAPRSSAQVLISVALPDTELRRQRESLRRSLLVGGLVALPISALLGWLVGTDYHAACAAAPLLPMPWLAARRCERTRAATTRSPP